VPRRETDHLAGQHRSQQPDLIEQVGGAGELDSAPATPERVPGEFGEDPSGAQVRPVSEVEGYRQ